MSEQKRDAIVGEALVLGMIIGAILIKLSIIAFIVALIIFSMGTYSLIQKAKGEKPKRWEALKDES